MSSALVKVEPQEIARAEQSSSLQLRTLDDVMRLGEVFAKSGYFSDAKDAARAVVKILAGQDMGLSPFAAMNGIFLSAQGRLGYAANVIAAKIKNSGRYDYRVREWTEEICLIEFFEKGESVGFGEFTKKDAIRAKLADKDTYRAYPKGLLFARALTQGARAFTPELFGGNTIYTPDEIEDTPAPKAQIRMARQPEATEAEQPEPIEAESEPLITEGAADEIISLWKRLGEATGKDVDLNDFLKKKYGTGDIYSLPQKAADELFVQLSGRLESFQEKKPDGLSQWKCTRSTAMAVLSACDRADKLEIPWREDLKTEYGVTSRKELDEEKAGEFAELVNAMVLRAEAKKRGPEVAAGS